MSHDEPNADAAAPAPTARVTAVVIPASGPPRAEAITPDLATLQRLVGGTIEVLGRDGWHAYLNDEGKLLGLPVNRLATDVLFTGSGHRDVIVGDVVLLGDHPGGGEASVPADVLDRVLARGPETSDITPAHLVAAVAHLHDEPPTEALILIGLADGRIDATVTSALHRLDDIRLHRMTGELLHPDITAAVVAIISEHPDEQLPPHRQLANHVRAHLAAYQVDVVQALQTPHLRPGTRWRNCDTGATGALPDLGPDPAVARRWILTGELALPSDRELAARLITDPATANRDAAAVIRLSSSRPGDQPAGEGQAAVAALTTAIEDLTGDRFDAGDHDLARMALSLHAGAVRNAALRLTGDHTPAARQLWTLLVRHTTRAAHHRAHPATLLALAAYLEGDARSARMALAVANLTSRANPVTHELLAALRKGMAPVVLRNLLNAALLEQPGGASQNEPTSMG